MNCCGQKRLLWQQKTTPLKSMQVALEPILQNPVKLYYHGNNNYIIKGNKTGFLYLFAPHETGLMVDGKDAPLLLADTQKFSLSQ